MKDELIETIPLDVFTSTFINHQAARLNKEDTSLMAVKRAMLSNNLHQFNAELKTAKNILNTKYSDNGILYVKCPVNFLKRIDHAGTK